MEPLPVKPLTVPDRPLKVAVLGTGFIGAVHAEAADRNGAEVIGFLGSTPERTAVAAERMGRPAFAGLAEVLDSDADVVHVATPNHLHAEQSLAVLDAGKHLVCEKPLTTDLAAARELHQRAMSSGLVHAVCFTQRFFPHVHEARARVRDGAIGAPHLVTGSYLQDWLLLDTDWNWRLDTAAGGQTRSISDIGSHWLDASAFILDSPIVSVCAHLQTVHPVRRRPVGEVETFSAGTAEGGDGADDADRIEVAVHTDDAAQVMIEFANGARGLLAVSQVSAGRKNALSIEVDGADGSLAWTSEHPEELWLGHRDAPNQVLFRDPATLHPEARNISWYPGGHTHGFADTFRGLVQTVYADVRHGGPRRDADGRAAYPDFTDGLIGMAVEDAIRQSARSRGWVDVERIRR